MATKSEFATELNEFASGLENSSEATGNLREFFAEDGEEPNKEKYELCEKLEDALDAAASSLREAAKLQEALGAGDEGRQRQLRWRGALDASKKEAI